jgi:CHAT domain-containing protein
VGPDATAGAVREALAHGDFHVFHYAGHGSYDGGLPETGGLMMGDGGTVRASDLKVLASHTPLRLAFLSCCLSARTARRLGRGDFRGVLDALARADVPLLVGYRWVVSDEGALALARAFYRSLWTTLSPSHALLEARRAAIMGPWARDEEAWASAILVCQTD